MIYGPEVTLPMDIIYGPLPGEEEHAVGPYTQDIQTKLQGAFWAAFMDCG